MKNADMLLKSAEKLMQREKDTGKQLDEREKLVAEAEQPVPVVEAEQPVPVVGAEQPAPEKAAADEPASVQKGDRKPSPFARDEAVAMVALPSSCSASL